MRKARKYSSQTIAEVLIVVLIIGIVVATALTGMTRKKTDKSWDVDSIVCIKNEGAANLGSPACSSSIKSCKYNRNNACNTIQYYADHSSDTGIANAASKVFFNVCNQGGKSACEYFIKNCQKNSGSCDIAGSDYDIQYYLNMPTSNATSGRYLIEDYTKSYYEIGYGNIRKIVDDTCCMNGVNTACAIMEITSCSSMQLAIGTTSTKDYGQGIALDDNGNIYIAGANNLWNTSNDNYVIKMNSSGNISSPNGWAKRIDTTNSADNVGTGIALDSSGNIYISGATPPTNVLDSGYNTMYLLKLDSTGTTILWQYTINGMYNFYNPNNNFVANNLTVDSNNNVYITGYQNLTSSHYDMAVIKLNSSGNMTSPYGFQKLISSSVSNSIDLGHSIKADNSGNIYVYGTVANNRDLAVIKMNSSGNITAPYGWQVQISQTDTSISNYANSIAVDSSGYIYIAGESFYNPARIHVIKMNSNGSLSCPLCWQQTLSGTYNELGYAIAADNKGNSYISGAGNNGSSNDDLDVIGLDPYGNIRWEKRFHSTVDDSNGMGIAVDNKGYVYVTGFTTISGKSQEIIMLKMLEAQSNDNYIIGIDHPYTVINNNPNYTVSDTTFTKTSSLAAPVNANLNVSNPGFSFR